ncbi:MAG: hypothetical protein QOK05_2992 [Chloroflexota bacterium]|jgi:hypothetical protein|nr:hypothetical protein [Chloroflexota bacterium]
MQTSRRAPSPTWANLAHIASLAAGFALVLVVNRHGWFRGDEWDFLVHYDLSQRPQDIFLPHNEHLSVIPLLVYKVLLALFGMRQYLPFVAVLAAAHVATAHVLWRLARRAGADPWICTALVAVFLAVGGGFDNVTSPFQMSFIGSTAFGLAAVLALDKPRPLSSRTLSLAWGLCLASMFCSGLGVAFTLVAGVFAALRHGRRAGLLVLSAPFTFYLVWFVWVGRSHVVALGLISRSQYLQLPDFVWRGLTGAMEGISGLVGAGAVLVLALGYGLFRARPWQQVSGQPATALAIGSVLFFLAIGPGRLVFGPQYATQSRYVYEASAILLVPAAVVLTRLASDRLGLVLVLLILGAIGLRNVYQLNVSGHAVATVLASERARILAAARLLSDGSPILAPERTLIQPEVLDIAGMRKLLGDGLVQVADAPPDRDSATLEARLQLEVTIRAASGPAPSTTTSAQRAVGMARTPGPGTCTTVDSVGDASMAWFGPGPLRFTVTSTRGGKMHLSLAGADDPAIQTKPAEFSLDAGHRTMVTVDAPGAALGLSLPAGTSILCGATVPETH